MKKLLCWIIGHGKNTVYEDGKGAAWSICNRCEKVVSAYSWHGRQPWKEI